MTTNLTTTDEAKYLLAKATPLPWRQIWEHSDPEGDFPAGIKGNDGEPSNWIVRNDDDLGTDYSVNDLLIVYAVNRLPDHEALREAAERLADSHLGTAAMFKALSDVEAILRRLRTV